MRIIISYRSFDRHSAEPRAEDEQNVRVSRPAIIPFNTYNHLGPSSGGAWQQQDTVRVGFLRILGSKSRDIYVVAVEKNNVYCPVGGAARTGGRGRRGEERRGRFSDSVLGKKKGIQR